MRKVFFALLVFGTCSISGCETYSLVKGSSDLKKIHEAGAEYTPPSPKAKATKAKAKTLETLAKNK